MTPPFLSSPLIAGPHGFFGREGGVSEPPFDSLNASLVSGDDPVAAAENRRRIRVALDVSDLVTAKQVHGTTALFIEEPFPADQRPEADALVTRTPGLAVGVLAADCVPILLAAPGIVAAVHAGWKGSLAGIVASSAACMASHGADRAEIRAVIGPCLRPPHFEVQSDLRDAVCEAHPDCADLFTPKGAEHWIYDHVGFVRRRLREAGIADDHIDDTGGNTLGEPRRFFSYRAARQSGQSRFGHNLSAIAVRPGAAP